MSETYTPDNLLDRLSDPATLAEQYERGKRRERELLDRHLGLDRRRRALGRLRLAPRPPPAARAAVAARRGGHRPATARASPSRRARPTRASPARPAQLDALPDASFDVVLHRLVLHHVAYAGPLEPCLRRGAPAAAPRRRARRDRAEPLPPGRRRARARQPRRARRAVHGTPDDIPLSPRRLAAAARAAGLQPELHAVSYSWRRLPVRAQRAVGALDRFGSAPGLRWLGHTFMLIARR